MAESHWGLQKPPFPSGIDLRLFYEGANQREALARLRFLLAHRRRLGLMLGASGLGKSMLLRVFAQQARMAGHAIASLNLLGLTTREFYWQLGTELQATVRVEDDLVRLFRQVNDQLQSNALQEKKTVLLLDDLDQAGPDLLSHLQRLLRSDAANSGWLTAIASANPAQLDRVSKSLMESVDLRIDLESWDELDTTGYVQTALLEAGAERPLFDDEAITQLHRQSEGTPRVINRLAEMALILGATSSLAQVDAPTIQAACESLNLPTLV